MSFLFMDGFDDYSSLSDMGTTNIAWLTNGSTYQATGGRTGGGALRSTNSGVTNSARDIGTQAMGTRLNMAGWFNFKSVLPSNFDFLFRWLSSNSNNVALGFIGSNQLLFARDYGNNNNLVIENGNVGNGYVKTQGIGTWIHIEAEMVLSNTGTGSIKVWLDGTLKLSYTGSTGVVGAGTQDIQYFSIGGTSAAPCDWDDVVFWTNAAGNFTTSSPIGQHSISYLRPTSNGATNQFTSSGGGGSTFANVDDAPFHDAGSTYNTTSSNSQIDLYNFADYAGSDTILAVMHNMFVDSGFASNDINSIVRSNGANYNSSLVETFTSGGTFKFWPDYWTTDPDTSAAWTITALNAAQFGIHRGSGTTTKITQTHLELLTVPTPYVPPTGTWAATEAKDVLGVTGGIISGTFGATEAKDTTTFSGHGVNPAPTFVNAGAIATQGFGTSLTPTLPGSRVNGNILLCMIGNGATAGQTFTFPSDWNVIDSFANSNLGGKWAWRFVDGTETNPTITWIGTTSASAKVWQFTGAVTVGAFTKLADQGFINNFSATAAVTKAANSLVVNLEFNNNNATRTSTPSGWTAGTNDGAMGMIYESVATSGGSPSAISAATLSGSARWISAEIELCSILPPIFAALASTEAKDVWTSRGSLIGGSWHSTEAKDLLHVLGYVPLFFGIAAHETPDFGNFQIFQPPIGVFAATEGRDIFAFGGQPTPAIGIDAHAIGGASDAGVGGGITHANVTIATTFTHDVIILGVVTGGFWHEGAVQSITDTAGLTWKRRVTRQIQTNHLAGNKDGYFEEWWAHKPTVGSTTITVTTLTTGAICLDATAIKGANADFPFDTHTANGWMIDSTGDIIDRDGTGHIGNPHWYVTTDSPKGLTLALHGSFDLEPDTSVAPGFTFLNRQAQAEDVGDTASLASMYKTYSTQQFGTTDVWFGPDATHASTRALLVENIVAADNTTTCTDDVVRWFFDGKGNHLSEQFGVGQTSVTTGGGGVPTFRDHSILIAQVLVLSAAGARVQSITDDGNHSGWERRSIVTNSSGSVSFEVWWVDTGSVPLNGPNTNITIHMDSAIHGGDYVNAAFCAINGANVFQRNEIWDHNGSLPATNTGTSGHQIVGPFDSSNDNVLVLGFGANIDATINNTDIAGHQQPPFLFFPPPGELASSGPPSFIAGVQFKFSRDVVSNGIAEFDVSPAAQSWLMIGDCMPVGPVSPPHGLWHSTEARDQTRHNGNFTAIGVASPGGWFGFPPNHAAVATSERTDIATNSGAFTAIWDINGWIAYVPAFMDLDVDEADDALAYKAWVLGPRTILGHMHAGENKDRLGFAEPHTFYTTPYSFGDRTSRITVTTNAALTSGNAERLVDGNLANGPGNAVQVANVQGAPMFFTFDFGGNPQIINELKWWQNGTSPQPGLWVLRASQDNAAWSVLSVAPFVLDGGNPGNVIGDISRNVRAFRYYQLLQTTNAGGNSTPQLWEAEFKAGGNGGVWASTERKDQLSAYMLPIPTATPIPARKRRLIFTS